MVRHALGNTKYIQMQKSGVKKCSGTRFKGEKAGKGQPDTAGDQTDSNYQVIPETPSVLQNPELSTICKATLDHILNNT